MTTWLSGVKVHDLHPAIGNGPFNDCKGVVLHVNVDRAGTPDSFWGNGNPGQVCPNFQVYKDGSIHQMLPLNWQPWCQRDGNFNYAAIETAGYPDEPLTDAQLDACARIFRRYHDEFGVPYAVVDQPGQRGLITHQAGGSAWGGHSCPGTIRSRQRAEIIARAKKIGAAPAKPATPAKPAKPLTIESPFPYWRKPGHVLGLMSDPSAKVHGGIDAKENREVMAVVHALRQVGLFTGPIGTDEYGTNVAVAVKIFQRDYMHAKKTTSTVGLKTWRALRKATRKHWKAAK